MMAQFLGDIAGMLEIFAIAAGLGLLHQASHEAPARFLRAAGLVLIIGGIGGGLCTSYYWLEYRAAGAFQAPHEPHQYPMVARADGPIGSAQESIRGNCPTAAGNVRVEASDTEDGAMLSFTMKAGDVEDLRMRVRQMAAMYDKYDGYPGVMWHRGGHLGMEAGDHKSAGPHLSGPHISWSMPRATSAVEDIDGGARIRLIPRDASKLGELREHAKTHVRRLRLGECWTLTPAGTP